MLQKANKETVFHAVRRIMMAGNGKCTVDSVLALTGGSKTTVARLMREHEAEIARIAEEKVSLPPEIHDDVRTLTLGIWNSALRAAKAQDEDYQRNCRAVVKQIEAEADRGSEANAALCELLMSHEATIAELRQSVRALEETVAETQASERQQRERADRAEASNNAKIDVQRELQAYLSNLSGSGVGDTITMRDPNKSATEPQAATGKNLAANNTIVDAQIDWVETLNHLNEFSNFMEECSEVMNAAFSSDSVTPDRPAPERVHTEPTGAGDNNPASLNRSDGDGVGETLPHAGSVAPFGPSEKGNPLDGVQAAPSESETDDEMTPRTTDPNADVTLSSVGWNGPTAPLENETSGTSFSRIEEKANEPTSASAVTSDAEEDRGLMMSPALAASPDDLLTLKVVASAERAPIKRPEFLYRLNPAAEEKAKEPAWDDPYGDRA